MQETHTLLAIATNTSYLRGVVGWVDLTRPDVAQTLSTLREGPGGRYLAGIRHQAEDETDPEWLSRAQVQRGLRAVDAAGLPFELLVRCRQLPAALRTVRAVPQTRFVIDHLAKPPIAASGFHDWARLLIPIAAEPNVTCKLAGLVTEANWQSWHPSDLTPYVTAALDWFGPHRLMFGSDWPLCLVAASYQQVKKALETLLSQLTADEHAAVFGGTATRIYHLRPARISTE